MISGCPDTTHRVDVAVVGAGVIGLTTAWALRRRGLTVALIDPAPGRGASRAAAGMLAPVGEVRFQQAALHAVMLAAAGEYPDLVRDLERAGGHRVGYRTTGTLVCAADPADRQTLLDLHTDRLRRAETVELLTTRAARRLEPALSPRLSGALLVPGDHQVDPRRLVHALLAVLAGPGTTHVPETAVGVLSGPGGRVTGVALPGGRRVEAAETVLATGTGVDLLADGPTCIRLPVRPVHGDVVRARLPEGAPRLIEHTVRGVVGGRSVYVVPRCDAEVVIGATEREDGREHPGVGGVHRLLDDACALVPGVADLDLHEVLARARPGTPDDLPLLGRVVTDDAPVDGLLVATGFYRHGVLLAPMAARLVADLVTGTEPGPTDAAHLRAIDPARFPAKGVTPVADHATPEVSA